MSLKIGEFIVAKKYKLVRKIGSGSFGEVYLALNIETGEDFAVKLEPIKTRCPQLEYEAKVYKLMMGGVGVPNARACGISNDYYYLVMHLLGPSLEALFEHCSRTFSMKTILMIADQMLARIEYFHSRNFIHRDIKPDNFLMGQKNNRNKVYIIDYGLSKQYRTPNTQVHIKHADGKRLTGTARYASINAHIGLEQSRRDDLESFGYVLLYFIYGKLPWQGLKAENPDKHYAKILEMKTTLPLKILCKGCPTVFEAYMKYCRGLHFEEDPDYTYLRQLFRNLFRSLGYRYDYEFDWSVAKSRAH